MTVLLKGIFEFIALFDASILKYSLYILAPILVVGLSNALYQSKYLFENKKWQNIRLVKNEKTLLAVIGIAYIALNIPSLMYFM